MQIKDFEYVRCGSNFPSCVDVRRIDDYHESNGVYAEVNTHRFTGSGNENFAQFRVHNADKNCALFSFRYEDQLEKLGYWDNSTVIWDSRWGQNVTAL